MGNSQLGNAQLGSIELGAGANSVGGIVPGAWTGPRAIPNPTMIGGTAPYTLQQPIWNPILAQ